MKNVLDIAQGTVNLVSIYNVDMRTIEHSLCEWDKYERVRLGQGTPRSKYDAHLNSLLNFQNTPEGPVA